MNRKGFTLIELILVIAILGILAISALPRFLNLSTNAQQASRDGVVGAVRAGIALYRANDMVTTGGAGSYPTSLDANANDVCATCFNAVLANGVTSNNWRRTSATAYIFNDGTSTTNFAYNATNGTFQ